jgi:hypothetical protein
MRTTSGVRASNMLLSFVEIAYVFLSVLLWLPVDRYNREIAKKLSAKASFHLTKLQLSALIPAIQTLPQTNTGSFIALYMGFGGVRDIGTIKSMQISSLLVLNLPSRIHVFTMDLFAIPMTPWLQRP